MAILCVYKKCRGEHGSHRTYKTPWEGNPRVNIQKDGKEAKRYQVKQVCQVKKLKNQHKNGVYYFYSLFFS